MKDFHTRNAFSFLSRSSDRRDFRVLRAPVLATKRGPESVTFCVRLLSYPRKRIRRRYATWEPLMSTLQASTQSIAATCSKLRSVSAFGCGCFNSGIKLPIEREYKRSVPSDASRWPCTFPTTLITLQVVRCLHRLWMHATSLAYQRNDGWSRADGANDAITADESDDTWRRVCWWGYHS